MGAGLKKVDPMARRRKQKFNVYRNGKIHVCKVQCETCIYRPGNKFHLEPGRLKQMTQDSLKKDTAVICHDTLGGDNAVCRGFFDRFKTTPLQLAERLGVIEEV